MNLAFLARTGVGPTASFVLLWSSGALFARAGLASASPFAFLVLRFALALGVLLAWGAWRGQMLPPRSAWPRTAATGLLLIGGYSICYLLALDAGLTPGVLATALGVQPVLTLLWVDRRFSSWRLAGLLLALAGLVLVVFDSLVVSRLPVAGIAYALAALGCVTAGSILQKRQGVPPAQAMPLHYVASLLACALFLPWQPCEVTWDARLALCVLWLGVVISVVGTLLLYRLIQQGDLVQVTALFYLVPGGTALLDWLVSGQTMAPVALLGLGTIVAGLVLVFRTPKVSAPA